MYSSYVPWLRVVPFYCQRVGGGGALFSHSNSLNKKTKCTEKKGQGCDRLYLIAEGSLSDNN